jgi:hypothetical protein
MADSAVDSGESSGTGGGFVLRHITAKQQQNTGTFSILLKIIGIQNSNLFKVHYSIKNIWPIN